MLRPMHVSDAPRAMTSRSPSHKHFMRVLTPSCNCLCTCDTTPRISSVTPRDEAIHPLANVCADALRHPAETLHALTDAHQHLPDLGSLYFEAEEQRVMPFSPTTCALLRGLPSSSRPPVHPGPAPQSAQGAARAASSPLRKVQPLLRANRRCDPLEPFVMQLVGGLCPRFQVRHGVGRVSGSPPCALACNWSRNSAKRLERNMSDTSPQQA